MPTKFTLAGENNPNWQMAEPLLLKIWARGILASDTSRLYVVIVMSWVVSSAFFLFGFLLRLAAVVAAGYVLSQLVPNAASVTLNLLFSSLESTDLPSTDWLWMYELAGYTMLVLAIIFVLGSNLAEFLRDTLICMFLMVTGMAPLRWLGRGLAKEQYFAQLVAKAPFMGVYLTQTIGAAPRPIAHEWDHVFDLDMNSNDEGLRKKLEALAKDEEAEGV
ncbi:MAG: hypothetical protein U5O39_19970 [Gammaproteobacteria bacterium]|nr:hypothetical protein [Gammaproteobacteria bacterium]